MFINQAFDRDLLAAPRGLTGDPALHPASFTRFVLPFQYQLADCLVPGTVHYTPCELSDAFGVTSTDRKSYFSVETAHVLHQRAQRFRLNNAGKEFGVGRFKISPLGEENRYVEVRAPEILLFEFDARAQAGGVSGPLCLGLLIVDVYFPHTDAGAPPISLAGMQQFNELFRFVYPPFAGHAEKYDSKGVLGALANEGWRNSRSRWQFWLELPLKTSAGNLCSITLQPHENRAEPDDIRAPQLFPFSDSRAFVHSCAVVGDLEMLTQHSGQPWADNCVSSGAWIRFLNVDGWRASEDRSLRERVTQAATVFEQDWAQPLTYKRWAHFGTLTGYTPHSAAMLAGWMLEPPAWQHFRTMYFDQSCLLIYLRAAMSACSAVLVKITLDIANKKDVSMDLGKFELQFARLVNLYYHPQISNQQQGIELYKIQRVALNIDAQFFELREEVQATRQMHAGAKTMNLTIVGSVLAVIATAATLYDPLKSESALLSNGIGWILALSFIGMTTLVWAYRRYW